MNNFSERRISQERTMWNKLLVVLLCFKAVCSTECPESCHCEFAGDYSKFTCTSLDFLDGNISKEDLNSVTALKINNNSLSTVSLKLKNFSRLQSLDLASNVIKELDTTYISSTVKTLNLSKNLFERLPNLTSLPLLQEVNLSGNPLVCDCEATEIRDTLLETSVEMLEDPKCASPNHLAGQSLLKVSCNIVWENENLSANEVLMPFVNKTGTLEVKVEENAIEEGFIAKDDSNGEVNFLRIIGSHSLNMSTTQTTNATALRKKSGKRFVWSYLTIFLYVLLTIIGSAVAFLIIFGPCMKCLKKCKMSYQRAAEMHVTYRRDPSPEPICRELLQEDYCVMVESDESLTSEEDEDESAEIHEI